MTENKQPIGELFTHVYLERGAPVQDSELFRRRLGGYLATELRSDHGKLSSYLKKETGLTVKLTRTRLGAIADFEQFFVSIDIAHLLNVITLVSRFLWKNHESYGTCSEADEWKSFVARVFREENLGYKIDKKCGVHYLVDEEFERNRASLLSCLDVTRYAGVRAAVESAHQYLDSEPRDTKASVRAMFESVEILVRLMIQANNLNKRIVEKKLKEKILTLYQDDETARKTISDSLDGFALWVNGLHNYRHGQGKTDPVAPPLDFAIYILSSGSSFLRWLAGVDKKLLSQSTSTQP